MTESTQSHVAARARRLLNGRSRELARLARTDIDSAWRLAWERARVETAEFHAAATDRRFRTPITTGATVPHRLQR